MQIRIGGAARSHRVHNCSGYHNIGDLRYNNTMRLWKVREMDRRLLQYHDDHSILKSKF